MGQIYHAFNEMATASLVAHNTFSDAIWLGTEGGTLILSGTWSATVTLQAATGGNENTATAGLTWVDADNLTTTGVWAIAVNAPGWYRAGVKTNNYSSGTVVINIRGG